MPSRARRRPAFDDAVLLEAVAAAQDAAADSSSRSRASRRACARSRLRGEVARTVGPAAGASPPPPRRPARGRDHRHRHRRDAAPPAAPTSAAWPPAGAGRRVLGLELPVRVQHGRRRHGVRLRRRLPRGAQGASRAPRHLARSPAEAVTPAVRAAGAPGRLVPAAAGRRRRARAGAGHRAPTSRRSRSPGRCGPAGRSSTRRPPRRAHPGVRRDGQRQPASS